MFTSTALPLDMETARPDHSRSLHYGCLVALALTLGPRPRGPSPFCMMPLLNEHVQETLADAENNVRLTDACIATQAMFFATTRRNNYEYQWRLLPL